VGCSETVEPAETDAQREGLLGLGRHTGKRYRWVAVPTTRPNRFGGPRPEMIHDGFRKACVLQAHSSSVAGRREPQNTLARSTGGQMEHGGHWG